MRQSLFVGVGTVAGLLLLPGCALPTVPNRPPIGIRQDSGVVSVVVPICPGDAVKSASITRMAAVSAPADEAWQATGFVGDQSRGIELGQRDWSSVRGDYSGWTWFSVDVTTQRSQYGAAVQSPGNLDKARSLPTDSFYVDGEVMTSSDYQAGVAKDFPCPPPAN